MKFSRMVTGLLSVALLAFMVSDTLGQDQGRRGGDRGERGERGGGRGGPGGFGGRGGPGGGPGGGRGGDPTMALLRIDAVKTELQISPDQEAALTKLAEQGRGERPEGVDFRNMSEEDRSAFFEKMRKQQEERNKKMREQLEEVLFPEQMERLAQIGLQIRGVQALGDADVASKLKITDAQKQELAEVREKLGAEMRDKMRELFSSGNRDGMREAFAKAREDMEKEVLAVLDTDQQKQFEEMKGEEFDMPEGGLFGRGGFGGGPGGGRGGFGGGGRPGGRPGGEGGRRRPPVEE